MNYNPNGAGRSLAQCLQDLREIRASQPEHDLSGFRYRNSRYHEPVTEQDKSAKKPKRNKVSDDE